MTTQTEVASWLPSLRRYARALVGNQRAGDALVCAALHKFTEDRCFGSIGDQRVALYKCLSALWNSPGCDHVAIRPAQECEIAVLDRRLNSLTSISRQIFLLISMESFAHIEAALILELTTAQFTAALTIARREVASQVATDVLIIEDELFIATDLEDILMSLGHHVIAIERTHADAVRAIRFAKPGLILADIQLADGSSGIEAANEILLDGEVPVVFITAYPERLLTGLRPEPTFLLTKPIKVEDVRAVVSQALFFETRARSVATQEKQLAASERHI